MKRIRNRNKVYTGPVGAKMRPPRVRAQRKPRRVLVTLLGGPLGGCSVMLAWRSNESTLPLAPLRGFGPGRYVQGCWEPL